MITWEPTDLLAPYTDDLLWSDIEALRQERRPLLNRPFWQPHQERLKMLPELKVTRSNYNKAEVQIGQVDDLDAADHERLKEIALGLKPWRKGPFNLFGIEIDAEWRSNQKWDRLKEGNPNLEGKRIADIGCSNGYYMYRMLPENPAFVIGFEPADRFFWQFHLMQRFAQAPRLQHECFGVEHLAFFPEFFDVIFCLGIIYHQRNPILMLENLFQSLRSGGEAVVESMGIPGDENQALCPPGRYAKARNVFFVPSAVALCTWMRRAGFVNVECISSATTEFSEQRATEWMSFESLEDFLDPNDRDKTIEGHPTPLRIAVRGRKP